MYLKGLLALLMSSLLVLPACGPERTFPPPAPTQDSAWTLRLTQTGGFAGVHLVIFVSSAGQMTAEDQRSGRTITQPLSEATTRELTRLLKESAPAETGRLPSACADCFVYNLEISSTAGEVHVRADDTTLAESGARPLIQYLSKLRDQALRSTS